MKLIRMNENLWINPDHIVSVEYNETRNDVRIDTVIDEYSQGYAFPKRSAAEVVMLIHNQLENND